MTYIIVQTGVYRHDIRGGFDDWQKAVDEATRLALADRDCHHYWEVLDVSQPGEARLVGTVTPKPANPATLPFHGKPVRVEWEPAE